MNAVEITNSNTKAIPRWPRKPVDISTLALSNKGKPQYKHIVKASMLQASSETGRPMTSPINKARPSKSFHKPNLCCQTTNRSSPSIALPIAPRMPTRSLSVTEAPSTKFERLLTGFENQSNACHPEVSSKAINTATAMPMIKYFRCCSFKDFLYHDHPSAIG